MNEVIESNVIKPLEYGESIRTCPCCDHVVGSETNLISFDYWKGRISQGGVQIYLEPMEADLLKLLLDRWPKVCSKEKLLVGLYGGSYCERSYSDNVGVFISKLRNKLKIFDIRIENIKCRGWWLVNSLERPVDKRN